MVEKFCCCCSLRSGAIAAAVLNALAVVSSCSYCYTSFQNAGQYQRQNEKESAKESLIDAGKFLVQAVLGTVCLVCLCVGIHKKKPNFILPWLIITAIAIIVWFIMLIILAVSSLFTGENAEVRVALIVVLLIMQATILFTMYMFAVVLAYYQSLKETPDQATAVPDPKASVCNAPPIDTKAPEPYYAQAPGGTVQHQSPSNV